MKRLGRGHGSGRGKTAGRGTKGQKARGSVPPDFEGGQLALTKRLPLLRGKGRNRSQVMHPVAVKVGKLAVFAAGTKVTLESLKKQGIVTPDTKKVKILNGGTLTVALTVALPCSSGAKQLIEKAGGQLA